MQSDYISRPDPAVQALRQARLARGMTQAELATAVDCAQSGVSRLEAGNLNALSDEKIRQLAEYLGVKIDLKAPAKGLQLAEIAPQRLFHYCASPWCPSCLPYRISDDLYLWPVLQPLIAERRSIRCAFCGEPMKAQCWHCNHAIDQAGAFCTQCGAARVRADDATVLEVLRRRAVLAGEAREMIEAARQVALLAGIAPPAERTAGLVGPADATPPQGGPV